MQEKLIEKMELLEVKIKHLDKKKKRLETKYKDIASELINGDIKVVVNELSNNKGDEAKTRKCKAKDTHISDKDFAELSLDDVNKMALEKNISYGKIVALKYQGRI